jgi:hypothetical protein
MTLLVVALLMTIMVIIVMMVVVVAINLNKSFSSKQESFASSYEHHNGHSGSVKGMEYIERVSRYKLLKKTSIP